LQVVCVKLVEEADASPLLVYAVEDYACAFLRNRLHRRFELRAAVAAQASEDVAGQALGVGSQEDGFCGIDLAEDNREVVLMTQEVLIGVELPVPRVIRSNRDDRLDPFGDEFLIAATVSD